MKENLHFSIGFFEDVEFSPYVPENADYGYWLMLAERFLKLGQQIEIHCWNEEQEAMRGLEDLLQKQQESQYAAFSGEVTPELMHLLMKDYLNSDGGFKWFSIFLSSDETTISTFEHWATEFFVPDISKETELYIRKIMPAETNFHLYEDEF